MSVPIISCDDVMRIIPNCTVIGEPINVGGQKIVFKCSINGILNAVKFIKLGNVGEKGLKPIEDDVSARLAREIKIMKSIDSPYIVKTGCIDMSSIHWNGQKILYYSEEWIEGCDLFTLAPAGTKMSPKLATAMAIDIVNAIQELNNHNKVHRDIKPANIMRRKTTGRFVLIDFGVAFDQDDVSLTRFGCVIGTKKYMSPEQLDILHKRDIDFRSDLFSLGTVLYEKLTGEHPFYTIGMLDDDLFRAIINKAVEIPSVHDSSIPLELSQIVCRFLNKQPSQRYRKCSFAITELDQVYNMLEVVK